MSDGSQKWELHFEYPKENCPGQWVPHTEPIEPGEYMTDEDDTDYDVWCAVEDIDINFWREYGGEVGEVINFSIFPVVDGQTWTDVDPIRGEVEFIK